MEFYFLTDFPLKKNSISGGKNVHFIRQLGVKHRKTYYFTVTDGTLTAVKFTFFYKTFYSLFLKSLSKL